MKVFKHTLIALLVAVSATSCEEWIVDVEPSTSLSGEVVLNSADGVAAVRASMYSKMRASFDFTTEYFIGASSQADELRLRPTRTRFQDLNIITDNDGNTTGIATWGDAYNVIQDANLLISAVPEGVVPAATLDRYRGEALAIRAFVMHHMVRSLGYEPTQTAARGFDLGIVLRTEPTLTVDDADIRPRSTVAEVYTQIRNDLRDAEALLAGVAPTNANNVFANVSFVQGVAARVELYAGNWAQARDKAAAAIASSGRSLASTAAAVDGLFNPAGASEAIFRVVVDPATEPIAGSNINSGPAGYTSDQWVAQIPTQKLMALYEAGDHRLGWYETCRIRAQNNQAVTNCAPTNTGNLMITKFYGAKGNFADDLPYMRLAELYLIQAEATAKAANSADAGLTALNALRTARNASTVAAGTFASLTAFEDYILEERMRELVAEGHRFFDLKRLGRDIPNTAPNSIKLRFDSHRMLGYIPAGVVSLSEGQILQNPGYN